MPIDFGVKRVPEGVERRPVPDFSVPNLEDEPVADLAMDLESRLPDFSTPTFAGETQGAIPDMDVVRADVDFSVPVYGEEESDDAVLEGESHVPDFSAPVFADDDDEVLVVRDANRTPDYVAPRYEASDLSVLDVKARMVEPDFEAPKYEGVEGEELLEAPGEGALVGGRRPLKTGRVIAVTFAILLALGGVGYAVSSRPTSTAKVAKAEPVRAIESSPESFKPQERVAIEVAHPVEVIVPVKVEGLNEDGSRIPVQFEGTTSEGVSVEKQQGYLAIDGTGLMMIPGSYTLTVVASPISADGVMYDLPKVPVKVSVDQNGACATDPAEGLTMVPCETADIKDAQIQAAMQKISTDPLRNTLTDALGESARLRRDEAVAERNRLRTEEQLRKAQEKQQQQQQQKKQEAPREEVVVVEVPRVEEHNDSGDSDIHYGQIFVEETNEEQADSQLQEEQPSDENPEAEQGQEEGQESGQDSGQEGEQPSEDVVEEAPEGEEPPAEDGSDTAAEEGE